MTRTRFTGVRLRKMGFNPGLDTVNFGDNSKMNSFSIMKSMY